ncbi:MAG: single-stranded DNA-binding protein [Acidobacteria bacterium]|nr:single-stranded DNA-binding protein [Acidobacteriota bacterium]
MARGLNKVLLIGNLGKDAETRFTPSGVSVTNFSLATARSVKDGQTGEWRDETDWHDIVLWRGENVSQYLTKGTQVFIEGRLQTRSWEDQNGQKKYRTEVVCDGPSGLQLLGGRSGGGGGDFEQRPSPARRSSGPGGGGGFGGGGGGGRRDDSDMGVGDDDVPF